MIGKANKSTHIFKLCRAIRKEVSLYVCQNKRSQIHADVCILHADFRFNRCVQALYPAVIGIFGVCPGIDRRFVPDCFCNTENRPGSVSSLITTVLVAGHLRRGHRRTLDHAFPYTTIATTTLCYYMAPIIVLIVSPILFREKLTTRKIICAVIAIIGMILVSGILDGHSAGNQNMRGVLLALSAALLYAIVVIINKKLVGIDAFEKTIVQLLSAGIVMVPYLLLTNGFGGGEWNTLTVVLLLIVGLVHTGISYALYFGSTDGLKAQTIAIFSYIDPVAAMLFSAVFLHEIPGIAGIIGAIMILGSAIVSEL